MLEQVYMEERYFQDQYVGGIEDGDIVLEGGSEGEKGWGDLICRKRLDLFGFWMYLWEEVWI